MARSISESTVRRLSMYLRHLEAFEDEGAETVSSRQLAERGHTTAAQVRKDLSVFGSFGKRGLGYPVSELSTAIRGILGLDRSWRVALVGAGRIGTALVEYEVFPERGFPIVAALDADPEKIGRPLDGLTVEDVETLEAVVEREGVDLVILAVPGPAAQEVLDRVTAAGVRAVLNFAPVQLEAAPGVALRDVNMVMELETLSFALRGAGDVAD